jgi:cytochrome c oxidase cbb3-type subunit 3
MKNQIIDQIMEQNNNAHVEKDELTGDVLLAGHEYDGIMELDNRLPRWWVWLFIITIVFAGIYMVRYHVLGIAPLQEEEYEQEMAMAAEMYGKPDQEQNMATLTLLTDEASLAAGKQIWTTHCVVCHLADGQGLVGPNLTDEFWIHGCSFEDIYDIIVVGVPEKGMISWKDQLTPEQIQQVSSFIVTLKGTDPPNPKDPQGEKCEM